MRLKTINESLNENFPPGAAGDSRAPYNQPSVDYKTNEIDGMVWDEGGDNELPVKIDYTYYEDDHSIKKYITDWNYNFVNPDDKAKASSGVEDDVKAAIEADAGKCEFV